MQHLRLMSVKKDTASTFPSMKSFHAFKLATETSRSQPTTLLVQPPFIDNTDKQIGKRTFLFFLITAAQERKNYGISDWAVLAATELRATKNSPVQSLWSPVRCEIYRLNTENDAFRQIWNVSRSSIVNCYKPIQQPRLTKPHDAHFRKQSTNTITKPKPATATSTHRHESVKREEIHQVIKFLIQRNKLISV